MTKNSKGHQIIIILSLTWSVFSLILQITALFFSQSLMQITSGWFFPEAMVSSPLLAAFRIELSLLITINLALLLLWKKEIEGKRFLWFIGLNYSAFLLFVLACLTLIANVIMKLDVVRCF
jgi:hypothetical protein